MDVNKYVRDKIEADKNLYLHEDQSTIKNEGTSAFVISNDKYRHERYIMTTGGMVDDEVQNQSTLDHRFDKVMNMLKDGLKQKGIV